MNCLCRVLLLWSMSPGIKATDPSESKAGDTTKFGDLVAWVRQNGGRVDDRLGLTQHQHGEHLIRGGVALQNIEAGSELLFIPWKIVLGTIGDTATVPDNVCEVLQSYASEVDAGSNSFWYPYLILDDSLSSVAGRVPSLWNDFALNELQGLPPYGSTAGLTDWYSSNCADGVSFSDLPRSSRQALLAAITRGAGMRFLPIYDLLNHHNGLLNTKSFAEINGDTITTTKDIAKGEEIFMSYRGGKDNIVSEVFRRYGFVESWPQYWSWTDQGDEERTLNFLLLPDRAVTIHPTDSLLSQIGNGVLKVRDLQINTEKHNNGLTTEGLINFSKIGKDLLNSFATTTEEDKVILHKMEHNLQQNINAGDTDELRDLISAVDYRMHFKDSIQTAVDVAERLLLLRKEANEL